MPGFVIANREVAGAITARLRDARLSLERKQYRAFYKEFFALSSADVEKLDHVENVDPGAESVRSMVAGFRLAESEVPCVNPAGTEAVIDLRGVHANGAPPVLQLRLVKLNGKWCLENE